MTVYEKFRKATFPIMPPLLRQVNYDLIKMIGNDSNIILDIGGRKSPYTIGLQENIVISELSRKTEVQKTLNLGLDNNLVDFINNNRSNIKEVVFEDFVETKFCDHSLDGIVCVEVIEHVENDDQFVKNMSRVLKEQGWVYITTPNGDFIDNNNPDHVRHYSKSQLEELLSKYFKLVDVYYAIPVNRFYYLGLPGLSYKRPLRSIIAIVSNIIYSVQYKLKVRYDKLRSAHLIAKCKK